MAQRRLPEGVPEEQALNEPVSYNAPPLHSHILRDSGGIVSGLAVTLSNHAGVRDGET